MKYFVMALVGLMATAAQADNSSLNCYGAAAGGFVVQYLGINQPTTKVISHQVNEQDPTKIEFTETKQLSFRQIDKDVYQADGAVIQGDPLKITIAIEGKNKPWDQRITASIHAAHRMIVATPMQADCEYK